MRKCSSQCFRRPATSLGLALIWVYRHCFSPFIPPCCRFAPSCSAYAEIAVRRFGLFRGSWLSLWRLLRCHPFYHGPLIDPVPEHWCGNPFCRRPADLDPPHLARPNRSQVR